MRGAVARVDMPKEIPKSHGAGEKVQQQLQLYRRLQHQIMTGQKSVSFADSAMAIALSPSAEFDVMKRRGKLWIG